MSTSATVDRVETSAYRIPTDSTEADGTFEWTDTTLVLVQVGAGDLQGNGWTYGSAAAVELIKATLAPVVLGRPTAHVTALWTELVKALRNIGRPGVGSMALSALDCALWDLKARELDVPLHRLLGASRTTVPLYGSGGFTTYDQDQLRDQLRSWVETDGMRRVKIKIGESWGTNVRRDLARSRFARDTIGPGVELFVDANGGYSVGQAVRVAQELDDIGVVWFEEPVSSDDLEGLRQVRAACKADIAAGEYGYTLDYFRRLSAADAVDCLQVDVTRCGGITELLRIAAVAAAHHLGVSGHCAPYQHAAALAVVPNLRHLEYFHDHVRIERRLFEGTVAPRAGELPLTDLPGNGLTWLPDAAAEYRIA